MSEHSSDEITQFSETGLEILERKTRRSKAKLEDLLENLGPLEEVDWGEPRGQEIW